MKKVYIGPQRISRNSFRTWCGQLLACLCIQAEADITNPDAFLPRLRDVSWARGSLRVFKIHQHHIQSSKWFQNDHDMSTKKLGPYNIKICF